MENKERKLVEVAFEITYECNLHCTHCYNSENVMWRNNDSMETNSIQSLLRELKDFGVQKVKLGGGEPLIREGFWDIYNYGRTLGLEMDFSSNGLEILEPETFSLIKYYKVPKIQISLDNVGEKHDEIRNYEGLYEQVEQTVKTLRENDVKVNISTTLTNQNHKDLDKILDFCKENDVFRWKIMKYIPKSRTDKLLLKPEEYKEAVSQALRFKSENTKPEIIVAREFDCIHTPCDYNDMQCFGGKSFMSIKPNGNVTPCSYIDDIICGNVGMQSLKEIWNSKKMIKFSQDYMEPGCAYAEKCRGGCKAINYHMNYHKIKGCDPYCWVKK